MDNSTPTTNPLAIASVVLGGIACLTACIGCYGFPFNILGLALGIVALTQIKADPSQGGKPLAQAGIGLSILSVLLVVTLIVLVLVFGIGFGVLGAMLESM